MLGFAEGEERGTAERGSTFWRKDKAECGLGFSNIYLRLSGFRIGFFFFCWVYIFFFFNIVPMWKIMGVSEASILYIYIYILALCWCDAQFN